MRPLLTLSYKATVAIAGYLIAKASGDGTLGVASAGTDALIGAVTELGVDAGDMADIIAVGEGEVRAGGNISFGDPLTSDANGKAVKAVPVPGSVISIIGHARADAVADDIIPYLAAPGVLATPAP